MQFWLSSSVFVSAVVRQLLYIGLETCELKVAKEGSFAFVDKYIDGFEVTVHYILRVKVCNSQSDLLNLARMISK